MDGCTLCEDNFQVDFTQLIMLKIVQSTMMVRVALKYAKFVVFTVGRTVVYFANPCSYHFALKNCSDDLDILTGLG